jgi:hypothetical protein
LAMENKGGDSEEKKDHGLLSESDKRIDGLTTDQKEKTNDRAQLDDKLQEETPNQAEISK